MKAIVGVLSAVTLFFLAANVSDAQDIGKKFGVGARLAYYDISDDQVKNITLEWTQSLLYEGLVRGCRKSPIAAFFEKRHIIKTNTYDTKIRLEIMFQGFFDSFSPILSRNRYL